MALSLSQVQSIFGRFAFRELGGGLIAPDPKWVARAIVVVRVPFLLPVGKRVTERIRCHRLVAEKLVAALQELEERGLRKLIHSYDGCYVPRHVCWNPKKTLSRHAWGIALDLNAAEFPFGSRRKQDPRLVEIFARQGFLCGQKGGGLWRGTLDPMHFEYVSGVQGGNNR